MQAEVSEEGAAEGIISRSILDQVRRLRVLKLMSNFAHLQRLGSLMLSVHNCEKPVNPPLQNQFQNEMMRRKGRATEINTAVFYIYYDKGICLVCASGSCGT